MHVSRTHKDPISKLQTMSHSELREDMDRDPFGWAAVWMALRHDCYDCQRTAISVFYRALQAQNTQIFWDFFNTLAA